jgi:hypothetical protein
MHGADALVAHDERSRRRIDIDALQPRHALIPVSEMTEETMP